VKYSVNYLWYWPSHTNFLTWWKHCCLVTCLIITLDVVVLCFWIFFVFI